MRFDRRILKDRRRRPTPLISRYTLVGRRQGFRREEDRKRGGYVDRYTPTALFLIILIAGLNILDIFFTMIILDQGGLEVNPIVNSAIFIFGDNFWIWKFGIVSFSLTLLCLHSKFRLGRYFILLAILIYLGVMIYQIHLLYHY